MCYAEPTTWFAYDIYSSGSESKVNRRTSCHTGKKNYDTSYHDMFLSILLREYKNNNRAINIIGYKVSIYNKKWESG